MGWWFPGGAPCRPACVKKLTRLNHFSFRLRPAALHPSCLTLGVTSACPMLATRWLTYLAGTGFSPTGIIDLARPHTPLISFKFLRNISINKFTIFKYSSYFLKINRHIKFTISKFTMRKSNFI